MSLVGFKHRNTFPVTFEVGTFYWIDKQDNTSELWFGSENGLIRLDNHFDNSELDDIISRLLSIDSDIESIQDTLQEIQDRFDGIDFTEYLTSSDLDGFARTDDIPTKVSELINDEGYITIGDLPEFLTRSDIEDLVTRDELTEKVEEAMSGYSPDLGDSDWDRIEETISEKVNEKTFDLTWKEV